MHRLDSVLVAAANKVANEVWRQMAGEAAKVGGADDAEVEGVICARDDRPVRSMSDMRRC